MKRNLFISCLSALALLQPAVAQQKMCRTMEEIKAPFSDADKNLFASPEKVNYPETWFHFVDGNVDLEGITKDLEAIAGAGISGIQFFHGGNFGGDWPGVKQHIMCLSPKWGDAVSKVASEADRLGLRLTMQNCPGWSLAGGPWINEENAMRTLVSSRTDIEGGCRSAVLPLPERASDRPWRNYKDIAVLAFPTPEGDINGPLVPEDVKADVCQEEWTAALGGVRKTFDYPAIENGRPHSVTVTFDKPETIRSITFYPSGQFNHGFCFELGISLRINAIDKDGTSVTVLDAKFPMLNWQDDKSLTFALDEHPAARYEIIVNNPVQMSINGLQLLSAARKNNWEAEAAWTLRGPVYECEHPLQTESAFIRKGSVIDVTEYMSADGTLRWNAPEGKWTVLRVGHVNSGRRNGPAPDEATGWECDKLSGTGADIHFDGYIRKLVEGPAKGVINSMLLDSWECNDQTWTPAMEKEFEGVNGYAMRGWIPALFGYVVGDHETTFSFLNDWRACINYLFVNNFWKRMHDNAKSAGINIAYETAAGDTFPADILEYFKYADVPMAEFWNDPRTDSYVGSINFKPIRPTASAARLYGKTRVSAESFTSFDLTWDEHFSRLKDLANFNYIHGVTHSVFHTYTHNPCADTMVPGTSFGSGIGTPFLRGQTWWKHMPLFTTFLARLSYMLERGLPVSDVLWYLGDGNMHKPDQNFDFVPGFKYDYCNQDVLLNRLSVVDGRLVTPEGIAYRVLWMPDNHHMLPATAKRLRELVEAGATVVGDKPLGIGTLTDCPDTYDADLTAIWGDGEAGLRNVGKGRVLSGMTLADALEGIGMDADVLDVKTPAEETAAYWLHRATDGADWYFVTAPRGGTFKGTLSFSCTGNVSIWDPVSGTCSPARYRTRGGRTIMDFDLPYAGCCFVVFDHTGPQIRPARAARRGRNVDISNDWSLNFPEGWDAPEQIDVPELVSWKDLPLSDEGKCFSGTATYTKTLNIKHIKANAHYTLNLGTVDEIAKVYVNGTEVGSLWCEPYSIDITDALREGENEVKIEVTGTWFNRLVFDAGQEESQRKTWVISGPEADAPLRTSGLIGPVCVNVRR